MSATVSADFRIDTVENLVAGGENKFGVNGVNEFAGIFDLTIVSEAGGGSLLHFRHRPDACCDLRIRHQQYPRTTLPRP